MENSMLILLAIIAVVLVGILLRRTDKKVDMNHKAPNVHNVQMKGKVGPATAADKPAAKTTKKKTTKKKSTKKKTSKKVAAKKAEK